MKQIVMVGPRKSKVVQVPEPQINDRQLLVKVTYTGMCHSEWYPWATAKEGDIYGHETVGVIAAVGKNVTGFKVGDRVSGLGGGGYKEYIVMEPEKTFKVPDNLADVDAIAEPLACLLSCSEKMMPKVLGDAIAIVGCGYMGLGMISLFKAAGYGDIVAVDPRPIARDNAKKFGATEVYAPDDLPRYYRLNWDTIGQPDLTRDGHKADLFNIGFPNVMEFTGTPDGLKLAGEMVCAHGRLGIGGYHNDGPRTIDYQLWNFKAFTSINAHERRIDYETTLCERSLMLLSRGIWKFTGVTDHVYAMEEFDKAQEEMESHANNFIKGAVKS
jgi:threonine dehydrogenase-like Zn-dependent dehydrogenase